jgi:enterochelin esterase-like enzyme
MKYAFLVLAVCGVATVFSAAAIAQDRQRPRPPEFDSVEVVGHQVTFRLWAPQANAVLLASSDLPSTTPFSPGAAMIKQDNGVWVVTLDDIPAGTYRYQFSVDGLNVIDPRNPLTSESNNNTSSLMTVPGSAVSDLKDVPHGAVAALTYYSSALQRFRRAHVYTPPGYEAGTDRFPLLYLLHGASDSDASWSTVGRANYILDNLIAAGQAKPMIVVMPMGHTGPFAFGPGGGNLGDQMAQFQRDFHQDLRPLIDRRYRTLTDRSQRAIAGLSMGGAQTLDAFVQHPLEFSYVGVFSSGVFGINGPRNDAAGAWEQQHAAVLADPQVKQGLKSLWFATGTEDFLLETTQETVRVLREKDFDVVYHETDGGHTWIKWREHYLPQFVQLLFQD